MSVRPTPRIANTRGDRYAREDPGRSSSTTSRNPPPRSIRPQRSIADIRVRSSRQDAPMPQPRSSSVRPRAPSDSIPTRTRESSTSTISSTSSSIFDRARNRSGYTSPTSSADDGPEDKAKPGSSKYSSNLDQAEDPPAGYGSSIWGRVTAAAGALTINVSKAWETGSISALDGEATPPGQESRLTRAMKAYHLQRARSPSDLPDWLFDESERRIKTGPRRLAERADTNAVSTSETSRSRGLRDIYDKAAATSQPAGRERVVYSRKVEENSGGSSTATSRLRAMREAKRNAIGLSVENRDQNGMMEVEDRRTPSVAQQLPPPVRVGLPNGPGRVRRI